MTPAVFALVLFAAALHAGWNAIVKGSGDKFLTTVAICLAAAIVAAPILPFMPLPAQASWAHLGFSIVLQTIYYGLVAAAYSRADMSVAYPIMRGTAPLMVALLAGVVFHESLPHTGWIGIGLISGGILSMAFLGRHGSRSGFGLALLNALVIAVYTLNDGLGARASGAPISYTLWLSLLTAPPILALALKLRGRRVLTQVAASWRDGLIGGTGAMVCYGVALWAMTFAPVAVVAALRETSILFATVISALVLGEKVGWPRTIAAAVIALGAAVLRLV